VQITYRNYIFVNFDWLKDSLNLSKPLTLRKMMTKILCGNFEKVF